jgi:hypothetical protein
LPGTTVYGSDPFTYDFAAALAATDQPKTRELTFGYGYPTKPKHGKISDPPVTLDGLRRHAKRHSMADVAEVAKEHGLNEAELLELGVAGSTADRVRSLADQGLVAMEIVKRLKLGLPTVRRQMREAA